MSETKYSFKCEVCGKTTILNEDEVNVEIYNEIGGSSLVVAMSNKEYYCEHCGSELMVWNSSKL